MPHQAIKVNGNMGLDFIWTQKWACPSLNRRRDLTLRAQGFHSGARLYRSEFQPATSFWEPLPRKWGIDFWGLVSLLGRQSRFRETLGNPQDVLFLLERLAAALADDTERLRRRLLGGVADHGQMRFHAGHRDARPAAHPGRIIT